MFHPTANDIEFNDCSGSTTSPTTPSTARTAKSPATKVGVNNFIFIFVNFWDALTPHPVIQGDRLYMHLAYTENPTVNFCIGRFLLRSNL